MAFFSCVSLITFAIFSLSSFFIVNSSTLQIPCNDPYKHFNLTLNRNGTYARPHGPPENPPALNPSLTKVLTINKSKGTWARIYLPSKALENTSKLPLVIYFHGGGFVFSMTDSHFYHDFCFKMANDVEAVVVSVEYRLAPEHRLPAAYNDVVEALQLIITNKKFDWLIKHVDYSNVFLMGSSAGGNIAYNVGLRVAAGDDQLSKIKGLILDQPYFGGTIRTGSEVRLKNHLSLSLCSNDMLWELSLPIGADRDHEYANPTVGDGPAKLEKIKQLGWRVLVTGCDGDPLVDRQERLVKLMEKKGVSVVRHFTTGGYHGVYSMKTEQLFPSVKSFISA